MASFGTIFLCLGVGQLLRRFRAMPEATPAVLNSFIIYISLPATALVMLHSVVFETKLLYPMGMAWIFFVLAALSLGTLGRFLKWDPKVTGALILTAGLGNTSFMGFPLLEALFGPSALSVGSLVDQPGSFFVLSSLGIAVASFYTAGSASLGAVLKKVFTFPPFLGLLLALTLHSWSFPEWFTAMLLKLSATLIPLALVSVGFQIDLKSELLRNYRTPLAFGLLFKLVLGPLFIAILYVGILGARGEAIQITLTEAAMAPMITAAVLASDYGLDAELGNLMIALGIPISLITVPLWASLTRWI